MVFQGHPEAELFVLSAPSYVHLQQCLFPERIENKSQAGCRKSTSQRDEFHVYFEVDYLKRNYLYCKQFRPQK